MPDRKHGGLPAPTSRNGFVSQEVPTGLKHLPVGEKIKNYQPTFFDPTAVRAASESGGNTNVPRLGPGSIFKKAPK